MSHDEPLNPLLADLSWLPAGEARPDTRTPLPSVHWGVPIREVSELPPDCTSRWDVAWGKYPVGGPWYTRWRLKLSVWRSRARDAWEVLRGNMEARSWED